MSRVIRLSRIVACAAFLIAVVLLPAGCSGKSKKAPKSRRIEGIAKRIDLKNNDVAMVFKDDRGEDRELRGTVRENTEVRINGRDSKLEDIRENDRIVVTGYKEGSGQDALLIATLIEVMRPEQADWKKAPTQPAGGDEPKKPSPTTQPSGKP